MCQSAARPHGSKLRRVLARALGLAALLVLLPLAFAQEPPATGATWVELKGELDPGMQSLLRRAIDGAKERGDLLVIEFDTPGGRLDRMTQIARSIDRARSEGVVVVGWVSGNALSAGALIAMVSDQLYMRTSATLGAAAVIRMTPGGVEGLAPEDPIVAEKTLSAYRAEWRAWAEQRGRPGALAAAMVDPELEVLLVDVDGERRYVTGEEWDDLRERGVDAAKLETVVPRGTLLTCTGPEAVRHGLANGIAESPAELLAKIGVDGESRYAVERTRSERLAAFFSSIAWLLIGLGILFAYMELQQPGLGLPGALAAACFGLLLFGRYLTGLADVPHFVLIGVGIVLVGVELFVTTGTLVAGIAGALLVFAGLVWSGLGPGVPYDTALERAVLLDGARNTLIWLAIGLIGGLVLSRLMLRVPFLRRYLVVEGTQPVGDTGFGTGVGEVAGAAAAIARPGAVGRALTDLRPVGLVELDDLPGRRLEAQVDGDFLEEAQVVRVVELRTGRLVVEAIEAGDGSAVPLGATS
ncbi:MAG: hypothetical protein GC161_14535 [Planctomycetaceae bacterium]|nr:hypothetical protein [Planctomycetaceae bacterium]